MRGLGALVVAVGFGLLGVVACSSPSGGASAPIPIEQLPAQFAAKLCDSLATCCQAGGFAYDSTTCRQTAQASLTTNIAMLSTPAVIYNAAAAGSCIDAYASALRSCTDAQTELATVVAPCAAVFTGTLPNGATCTNSNECAKPTDGSAYCNTSTVVSTGSAGAPGVSAGGGGAAGASAGSGGASEASTGTCVQEMPDPHGKAGDPCVGDCTTSIAGESCSGAGSLTGSGATAVCYRSDGLYCGSTGAAARVCTPIAAIGSPCTSGGCVTGAFCNAGTCAAQYASGPCGSEIYDACASTSYCDTTAQCVPRLADGAVCTSSNACQSDDCQYPNSSSSSGGGTSPPAGGSGGASSGPTQGVCAKAGFTTAKTCMGQFGN